MLNNFTIRTVEGRDVVVGQMTAKDVTLPNIVQPLSRQCRYAGRMGRHYSVAEHAVHVARVVLVTTGDATLAFEALHHDDDEAFLIDFPGPLKHMPEMQWFRDESDRIHGVVAEYLDMRPGHDPYIKEIDKLVGQWEKVLILNVPETTVNIVKEIQEQLVRKNTDEKYTSMRNQLRFPCWHAEEAEFQFMAWHNILKQYAIPYSKQVKKTEETEEAHESKIIQFPTSRPSVLRRTGGRDDGNGSHSEIVGGLVRNLRGQTDQPDEQHAPDAV